MRYKKLVLGSFIFVLVALAAFSTVSQENKSACHDCNIVLISAEPLQKEHMSLHGYNRDTTPEIENLSKSSVVFSNAFTTSGHTLPATFSTFTSLYPTQHNITPATPREKRGTDNFTRVAEVLNQEGYYTAGIDSRTSYRGVEGISKGFDFYSRKSISDAPRLVENIVSRKDRYFIYIQSFVTHAPYSTRAVDKGINDLEWIEPYREEIRDRGLKWWKFQEEENLTLQERRRKLVNVYKKKIRENSSYREAEIAAYDNNVYYLDSQVGRIKEVLREKGELDNTIIVFTSQHGEMIGEKGVVGHGTLYNEVMSVPLIIRLPEGQHREVKEYASLVDLAPTLLDLAGVKDERFEKQSKGISLKPLIEGKEVENKIIFGIHNTATVLIDPEKKLKYFKDPRYGGERVYNLTNDWEEENPINEDDIVSYMKSELREYQDITGLNLSKENKKEIWPYYG